jgi:hypothetical protein
VSKEDTNVAGEVTYLHAPGSDFRLECSDAILCFDELLRHLRCMIVVVRPNPPKFRRRVLGAVMEALIMNM